SVFGGNWQVRSEQELIAIDPDQNFCIEKAKIEAKKAFNLCLADRQNVKIEEKKQEMKQAIAELKQKYENEINEIKARQRALRGGNKSQLTKKENHSKITKVKSEEIKSKTSLKHNTNHEQIAADDKYQITLKRIEISPHQNAKSVDIPDPIPLESEGQNTSLD
ncbi:MAG: host-nuclease inhibitor Gam family protein, partial [Bdellovibrionaceae bacterium]|nr:host-nuclease inhibitor Gam family protein [Pseudobdellovibrionaceae bacterium]